MGLLSASTDFRSPFIARIVPVLLECNISIGLVAFGYFRSLPGSLQSFNIVSIRD
jgi:hypothetical protein